MMRTTVNLRPRSRPPTRPRRPAPLRILTLALAMSPLAGALADDGPATLELTPEARQRCLATLRAGLHGGDFWPSMHAAEALTLGGWGAEVRGQLAARLETEPDLQRRCGLARELVRAGDASAASTLLAVLAGDDAYGHVHAAESLYKVGIQGDGAALRRAAAQEQNVKLQLMAAGALARTGHGPSLKMLRARLAKDEPETRQIAAWLLGRVGDRQDLERLRAGALREDQPPLVTAYHHHALAALGDPAGRVALIENLSSPDDAIRTYAATFAGDARAVAAGPRLIEMLDDPHADARIRAAQSLLVLARPEDDSLLSLSSAPSASGAAAPAAAPAASSQLLYDHLVGRARQALERRRVEYEMVRTPVECREWQTRKRGQFLQQIGGLPERTPLDPQVVGKLDGGDYTVEKIIYQSRPQHHVTAALFLPNSPGPHPAVLIACGHSKTGKAAEYNQRLGILLAKNGIAALCYDPIGQGERSQVLDAQGQPVYSASTTEHFLAGVGAILVGGNTAQYRIWDGIRGIDYLVSRSDIRGDRIGCTGCSGGGTLTSYIMALDDRVACAAPACYLTTFGRLLETIGPQDAEQNIFGQLAVGLDHPDYVLLRAPRPTLICATTGDFFDIHGTWDTFRQAKRFYTRLGHSERVELIEDEGKHGVTLRGREAIVRWMRRWLLESDGAVTDPGFEVWTEEQLRCAPQGQVLLLPQEKSVFDLNREAAESQREARAAFAKLPLEEARAVVRKVAGIRGPAELANVQVRAVGPPNQSGRRLRRLVIEPSDGIPIPALRTMPQSTDQRLCLFVPGEGKQAAAQPQGILEQLDREAAVLAIDLRGIGETQGGGHELLGDWKNYFAAYLLGESLVGQRADEVLAAARWLKETEGAPIHLVASGEANSAALHAAAVAPELFASIKLLGELPSWLDVVASDRPAGQLTQSVHGALRHYDVLDLMRLAGKVETAP